MHPPDGCPPPAGFPSMRDALRLPVPVMRHIPCGCRTLVGQALGRVCSELVTQQSWESLLRFTIFAKYVLRATCKGGKKHKSEALRNVKERALTVQLLPPPLISGGSSSGRSPGDPARRGRAGNAHRPQGTLRWRKCSMRSWSGQ